VPLFVDTNVLVYARDSADPDKHARATEWIARLWRSGEGRVSFQVLQEYYVTTTRKLIPGLRPQEARADVEDFLAWQPVPVGGPALRLAWSIQDRFGLSFWDALVAAAAHIAGCDVLLTEDLQHGADLDGLRVVDPFREDPTALLQG
jgi:predicted nucleic acid-binding protein